MKEHNGKKCFREVTNEEIYNEIVALRNDIVHLKSKAKVNTWISTTALSLVVGLTIGLIFS
jgi:ribosomal protein L29